MTKLKLVVAHVKGLGLSEIEVWFSGPRRKFGGRVEVHTYCDFLCQILCYL